MTRITTTTLPEFYKNRTVGFDSLINELNRTFSSSANTGYPPYNIALLEENKYMISLAVAGFSMEDLSIVKDATTLTIQGSTPDFDDSSVEYFHKGIAGRNFERKFQVAQHVKVTEATLELGILNIFMTREIPEELQPKKIEIKNI